MRRFLFILLLMGVAVVAAAPVAAGDVPPVCIPDPRLTLHQGGGETWLDFEPRIHVLCPLWDDFSMYHPAELSNVQVTVWQEVYIDGKWEPYYQFITHYTSEEIGNLGGTFYNLNGTTYITGETTNYYRYALIVSVIGAISHDPISAGGNGNVDDAFQENFYSPWVYGPDSVEVDGPFRERPDELKDHQRQTHSPATGLQSN